MITFFIPDFTGGGAEKVIIQIANAFNGIGEKVEILVLKNSGKLTNKIDRSINVVELDMPRMLYAIPFLVKYIINRKPKVVISSLLQANVAIILANILSFKKTRTIVRVETTLSEFFKHNKHTVFVSLSKFLVGVIFNFSESVIALSNHMKNDLVNNFGVRDPLVSIIPNPVYDQKEINLTELKKVRVFEDSINVITIGRLVETKDFSTLIRAIGLLNKRGKDFSLTILGEGELYKELKSIAKSLNIQEKVYFAGFKDNKFDYLKGADIYVLSSKYEGLPNSLIEALSAGLKIVATDCPGGVREILNDGEFGEICPVGDYKEMADAILKVSGNKIKRKKNLETHLVQFSIEKVMQKWYKKIKTIS